MLWLIDILKARPELALFLTLAIGYAVGKIQIGTFTFEILHLPGHTPGHVGFIEHEKNIAFTGDVLFQNSIGRTDFPRGDFDTLISSIKNKLFTLNDDMLVIAGHGPYTTIGQEKRSNPFLK